MRWNPAVVITIDGDESGYGILLGPRFLESGVEEGQTMKLECRERDEAEKRLSSCRELVDTGEEPISREGLR